MKKATETNRIFTLGLLLIFSSLILSYIMTIHRELIFRPEYYGDWFTASFISFDFDFLKAYLSNPSGLFLFLLTLGCFLVGCFLIFGAIFIEDFSIKMNKIFSKKKETQKHYMHNKYILRISGTILIFIGIGIACFWYFRLLPMYQRHDFQWYERFSPKGRWKYIQNNIHRYGWTQYDFHMVGNFGDKTWAEWILAKALDDSWLYGCGYKYIALNYITNQAPVNDREYVSSIHGYDYREKKWAEWWKQNKNKSQIEWIRDGFSKYGVKVSKTPSVEECKALLSVLGDVRDYNTEDNKTDDDNETFSFPEKVEKEKKYAPDYLRYNAFRWLRDSGFKPVEFTIRHVTKSSPKEIIQGLKTYQRWNSIYPWHADVGILPLPGRKKFPDDDGDYPRPAFFNTWIQVSGHCFMILPIVVGVFLLFRSCQRKKEAE
jgi:hypothetical protein